MIIKIINFIHGILVFGLVLSVFVNSNQYKKISLTLLVFILIQYITNYGKCGLTELEYVLKGEKYQEGFIYRLVKPVITLPEQYVNNFYFFLHIIWIIILYRQLEN